MMHAIVTQCLPTGRWRRRNARNIDEQFIEWTVFTMYEVTGVCFEKRSVPISELSDDLCHY